MTNCFRTLWRMLGAACLLTAATACHYLRSSEKINEIGCERIVYGPIEDQCLYRLDGKYYMKRQIHKYKRTPKWTGMAFIGMSNPTIYRRSAEQGTPQYVYMECALEESDYYLKRDRDGSYAGSWKSYGRFMVCGRPRTNAGTFLAGTRNAIQ